MKPRTPTGSWFLRCSPLLLGACAANVESGSQSSWTLADELDAQTLEAAMPDAMRADAGAVDAGVVDAGWWPAPAPRDAQQPAADAAEDIGGEREDAGGDGATPGPKPKPKPDAGPVVMDAGRPQDASTSHDAGGQDSGPAPDAAASDASVLDANAADAGGSSQDASAHDAAHDAEVADAGLDAAADAGSDGGDDGSQDAGAAACTSKPGRAGLSARAVTIAGLVRTFDVYIPSTLPANQPAPLLFAHHGFGIDGNVMRTLTRFTSLADQQRFIAVFPDGQGHWPWNYGSGVCGATAFQSAAGDDFAFVDAMLASVEQEQCVDRARVYASGFSLGAYFTHHLGCKRRNRFAAIAPHSGGTYMGACSGSPLPVLLMHGTADSVIAADCGRQARDIWVERNGCGAGYDSVPIKGGHCEWQHGCPSGGEVVLCLLDDMGHGWAGAAGSSGGGTQYQDASALIWDFFSQH